jgi:hypothetical protein
MSATITDKLNFVPVMLWMMFENTVLAIGTGFFYRWRESMHLVTAWHNFTGRCPDTNKPLHTKGGVPDSVRFAFPYSAMGRGKEGIVWMFETLPLYKDTGMESPLWFEYPKTERRVDVVTMPVPERKSSVALAINDPSLGFEPIALLPSLDVFILGYPKGMSGGAFLPIWKRGSIATEPGVDLDGLPKLYVDTTTREGMSGAPVFAQQSGFWIPEGKTGLEGGSFSKGRRFLGIYTGRVGDDPFQAQLGIVWKQQAIETIIAHSMPS